MLQFRSYMQPLLILAIVPFGMIGAVWGHALLGLPLTLFSMFGLVALSGVVINDSIVLIDFINSRVREGTPIRQALLESGERRFRPILLTSLTTIAGLIPLMMERSFQAQLLIPMAASLAFGLMLVNRAGAAARADVLFALRQLCREAGDVAERGRRLRAYPKRGLTLWRRVDFIECRASPERVRPLFG